MSVYFSTGNVWYPSAFLRSMLPAPLNRTERIFLLVAGWDASAAPASVSILSEIYEIVSSAIGVIPKFFKNDIMGWPLLLPVSFGSLKMMSEPPLRTYCSIASKVSVESCVGLIIIAAAYSLGIKTGFSSRY